MDVKQLSEQEDSFPTLSYIILTNIKKRWTGEITGELQHRITNFVKSLDIKTLNLEIDITFRQIHSDLKVLNGSELFLYDNLSLHVYQEGDCVVGLFFKSDLYVKIGENCEPMDEPKLFIE